MSGNCSILAHPLGLGCSGTVRSVYKLTRVLGVQGLLGAENERSRYGLWTMGPWMLGLLSCVPVQGRGLGASSQVPWAGPLKLEAVSCSL